MAWSQAHRAQIKLGSYAQLVGSTTEIACLN